MCRRSDDGVDARKAAVETMPTPWAPRGRVAISAIDGRDGRYRRIALSAGLMWLAPSGCWPRSSCSPLVDRLDFVTPNYRSPADRSQASRPTSPRSGLERSDFVHWPRAADFGVRRSWRLSGQTGHHTDVVALAALDPSATFHERLLRSSGARLE